MCKNDKIVILDDELNCKNDKIVFDELNYK